MAGNGRGAQKAFQSTLSVRRATAQMDSMFHIVEHLSFVQVQE